MDIRILPAGGLSGHEAGVSFNPLLQLAGGEIALPNRDIQADAALAAEPLGQAAIDEEPERR